MTGPHDRPGVAVPPPWFDHQVDSTPPDELPTPSSTSSPRRRNEMAAVMTTPSPVERCSAGVAPQPNHLTLVPMPPAGLGRPPRVSAATYWRRRLAVALGAVIVVLIAGQAGAALGSTPLEAPGRPPSVTRYVVRSGDSLWTVAGRVAPDQGSPGGRGRARRGSPRCSAARRARPSSGNARSAAGSGHVVLTAERPERKAALPWRSAVSLLP